MEYKLTNVLRRLDSDDPPTSGEVEVSFSHLVDELLSTFERARKLEDSSVFASLQAVLDDLRGDLRESVQTLTREDMWNVIKRLRDGADISDEEMELIRLWVIGDAAEYVDEENNFDDWIQEFDRLTDQIRGLREGAVEVGRLGELRALIKDARGVAWSISRYLQDRERVQHFEQTIAGGLDGRARDMLANILARSFNSDQQ